MNEQAANAASARLDWKGGALVAGGVSALASLVFLDLWLAEGQWFPSHFSGDTTRFFVYLRSFTYAEFAHGNIPLWNPFAFSGYPYVGVFQTAIFYPLNLFYLVLPHAVSISLEFILHQSLLAGFAFVWVRSRGCSRPAGVVAALIIAFAAPTSLRVLAGQLSVLDTYAWFPLLLLSVDRLWLRPSLVWSLTGIGAVSMMILAGHPPTVLMTGVATGLWVLFGLPGQARPIPRLLRLAPVAIAPLLLAAAQLWPGLHTASEGLRSDGMNYTFATSHSFPPLQLLTFFVPEIFGNSDIFSHSYFGSVYFWDATAFISIVGFLLACHGALHFRVTARSRELWTLLMLVALSLGSYTPIYRFLYFVLPGFDLIRAPSKYFFFASIFMALFAAVGFDLVRQGERSITGVRRIAFAAALALSVFAVWLWATPTTDGDPGQALRALDTLLGERDFDPSQETAIWQLLALRGCIVAVVFLMLSTDLIDRSTRSRGARRALVALMTFELVFFAWLNRGGAIMSHDFDGELHRKSADTHFSRPRLLRTTTPDAHMVHDHYEFGVRRFDVWGYDPVVLQRYARFMAFTQGVDLDLLETPSLLQFIDYHPLHAMLRVDYELEWWRSKFVMHDGGMNRFHFLSDVRVVENQDRAHEAMSEPGFDPRQTVVLETRPAPFPVGPPPSVQHAAMRVLSESTDHIDLEFDIERPTVLLMTDSYSNGWRAVALEGSSQREYDLLPANATLRAVPVEAGHHVVRIEFAPFASTAGHAVSLASLGVFVSLSLYAGVRARRRGDPPAPSTASPQSEKSA